MHSLIIFGLLFPGEFTAGTDPRPERERGPTEIQSMALTEALFMQRYPTARGR